MPDAQQGSGRKPRVFITGSASGLGAQYPQRLTYLSSSMHTGGRANLSGMDWTGQKLNPSS